jgi:hypothetical protein
VLLTKLARKSRMIANPAVQCGRAVEVTMIGYRLEHLFSYNAFLDMDVIGAVAEGVRINFLVTRGEFSGPKLKGKLRPSGGDWLTIRTDGVALLDVRATFESDDGALIYTSYTGVADLGEGGYQKFLAGEPPVSGLPLHVVPRYQTSHPSYIWLNRLQCLGIGEAFLERNEVHYDIYAVR